MSRPAETNAAAWNAGMNAWLAASSSRPTAAGGTPPAASRPATS